MTGITPGRLAVVSLGALLLFALVFTIVETRWGWPGLPYEALRDLDLAAGFAFTAAVVAFAVRAARRDRSN